MKHLLSLLAALAILCATANAQTMKALMFGTNGQVVANTTNLTFTNATKVGAIQFPSSGGVVSYDGANMLDLEEPSLLGTWAVYGELTFANAATTRANLGFSTNLSSLWAATNASNARSALGFSTNLSTFWVATNASNARSALGFSTNLSTFWVATNASNARSAVGLGATWLTNTNVTNFRTEVGLGASNAVNFQRLNIVSDPANSTNFHLATFSHSYAGYALSILASDEDLAAGYDASSGAIGVGGGVFQVKYGSGISDWGWPILTKDNGANLVIESPSTNSYTDSYSFEFNRPIKFNNTTNTAATRTNLGLPLAALTNTSNVTAMRALSGSTNTNTPYSGSVSLTNTNTLVFSNGILQSVQ